MFTDMIFFFAILIGVKTMEIARFKWMDIFTV